MHASEEARRNQLRRISAPRTAHELPEDEHRGKDENRRGMRVHYGERPEDRPRIASKELAEKTLQTIETQIEQEQKPVEWPQAALTGSPVSTKPATLHEKESDKNE